MGRLYKYCLLASVIMFSPMMLMAAEGEEEPLETEVGSTVDTASRMIRQTSKVRGYQPLTVVGQEIDAAYIEETLGVRHGAIILLHDKGEKFESHGVITPLRHSLPEYGWSTLTLSFHYPFEPNILLSSQQEDSSEEPTDLVDEQVATDAPEDELEVEAEGVVLPPISNQERIQAALAFLQAKDIKRILFLGHGAGGDLAIELLDTIKTPVSALILIGSTAMPENEVFDRFNFPIFDIYGTSDLAGVPAAIKHRKVAMKRVNNSRYQVRRIVGADHVFSGLEVTLTATINGWLRTTFVEQADN